MITKHDFIKGMGAISALAKTTAMPTRIYLPRHYKRPSMMEIMAESVSFNYETIADILSAPNPIFLDALKYDLAKREHATQ